jgi:hypothetical protein
MALLVAAGATSISRASQPAAFVEDGEPLALDAGNATDARGDAPINGWLPPVVIQHTVHREYDRLRRCYLEGQDRNPSLRGRVTVRFVIDRTGSVHDVVDGGSTMADAEVVRCVLRVFSTLQFPRPEGNEVTVVYPIMFSPEPGPDGAARDGGGG